MENVWLNPTYYDAEDGQVDQRVYFYKDSDASKEPFATVKYAYFWLNGTSKPMPIAPNAIILDEKCLETYAKKLIPRAIAYSGVLLDYFFRGTIEARNVALIKNASGQVTGLNLEIKNSSMLGENPELFVEGTIELVSRYKVSGDPDTTYTKIKDINTIATESDAINTDYISVAADFSNPIPPGAMDLSMRIFQETKYLKSLFSFQS